MVRGTYNKAALDTNSVSIEEAGKWRMVIYAWDFVDAGFL